MGHASTIITANVYFDKEKIVIDCTEEITKYITKVKPKESQEKENLIIADLDTNSAVTRFIN